MRFVIGGHGPADEYYRDVAKRLGIADRVKFLGFVSEKDLPHLYAMSDIQALTTEIAGIEKVLNDSATYRKGAIETAREFSIERATDRLLEAYNFVLSKRAID